MKLIKSMPMRAVVAMQYVGAIIVLAGAGWLIISNTPSSGAVQDEDYGDLTLVISAPASYQIFQRDEVTDRATIHIEGSYTGIPTAVEASWNGAPFRVISTNPSGGRFTGELVNQRAGQGTLVVRFVGDPSTATTVGQVGVGDIFVVAGQSNAVGHGNTLQLYTPSEGITATLFGNDDAWKELRDPYDSADEQVDMVSADKKAGGSIVPLLATHIVASERVPVAFVPTAKGGTTVKQWQPGEPLYESMKRRINAVGGKVRAVLWYQGESDAKHGMSRNEYAAQLGMIVRQLTADFPDTRMMVGQIGQARYPAKNLEAIRQAQADLWDNHPSILPGPVTFDIDLGDEGGDMLHFKSDADVKVFADRWWDALKAHIYIASAKPLYGATSSCDSSILIFDKNRSKICS